MENQEKSGLDIDLGNACSRTAFGWAKRTFVNRQAKAGETALDVDGAFSNMMIFGKERIGITSDGIGTKIELAERTGIYDTLGFDLVAMVVDDLATAGFEPTSISNIIDADRLDHDIIDAMMRGLHDAANFASISISGGEIAELGNRINGYGERMHFNWASTAIGYLPAQLARPIDGRDLEVGDVVISLQSPTFRSNGFSKIRRVMQATFGDEWHNAIFDEEKGTTYGQALLAPCLIYSPLIQHFIQSDIKINGIAHITGGGIADNFSRVLRANQLGAVLDSLHAPTPLMQKVQTLGNVSDEDAYLYWNMGNGMLLAANPSQAEQILALAAAKGYQAKIAGRITEGTTCSVRTHQNNTLIHNYLG